MGGVISQELSRLKLKEAVDGDPDEFKETLLAFFGNVGTGVYTLYQAVAGGISWVEITRPLVEIHWTNAVVFSFYIFFTVFALTNIITGIFVDTAITSAANDRDEVVQASLA